MITAGGGGSQRGQARKPKATWRVGAGGAVRPGSSLTAKPTGWALAGSRPADTRCRPPPRTSNGDTARGGAPPRSIQSTYVSRCGSLAASPSTTRYTRRSAATTAVPTASRLPPGGGPRGGGPPGGAPPGGGGGRGGGGAGRPRPPAAPRPRGGPPRPPRAGQPAPRAGPRQHHHAGRDRRQPAPGPAPPVGERH